MKGKITDIQEIKLKEELKEIDEALESLKKCQTSIKEVFKKYESYFFRFETLKKNVDDNEPLALPMNYGEPIIIAIALKNYLDDTESEIEELEIVKQYKKEKTFHKKKSKTKKKSSKK